MKLYHASTTIVEKPDIAHSRDKLDFGIGFYLTQIKQQAINYAQRFLIRGIDAYLNEYCLDDNLDKYIIKTFANYDEEWLDYVALCRKGKKVSQHYDIVSGGIANDKVFNTVDLYFAGIITKDEALGRLKYQKSNHQLCILNQELLNKHLHFIKAHKL